MKVLIVLQFCLGLVVCRDTLIFNYPPSAPLEFMSAHSRIIQDDENMSPYSPPLEPMVPYSPAMQGSGPEVPLASYEDPEDPVPEDWLEDYEEEPKESEGYKDLIM